MRALQFGDSMLPVGSFSFSSGLESAVQERIVHDRETLRQFVLTAAEQAATGDGVAVLETHRAARANDFGRIVVADHAVFSRKLSEEMRTMTIRMGRKLAEMAVQTLPSVPLVSDWLAAIKQGAVPGCYPIGQAIVFASLDLSEQDVFAVHQYGVASTILGAALRLMKVSHLDTQALLFEVNEAAGAAYQRVANLQLDDMSTFAPVLDILAAIHVKSKVRMFMN
ncbi:urease accessory protein UreF [Schlesneria paludicola]|uniref:urease accessory protein UreF n=1 Tax=Schlesneria paludicola TaxID=360056 RepID=UPI00029A9EA0